MIVSVNSKPELSEFRRLMANTDQLLNVDALKRPKYYATRGGNPLEDDVVAALNECAKGTPFQGTIEKVSGQRFPDIVASKFYGVEVKSTKDDHWTSTGSSILETTRVANVERIFMTFGKLGGNPIQFLSKPYEECLYGIAVTHMPRYLIDMRLEKGNTIFDKIGIPYDELRQLENPIAPVSAYYRSQLKPGESLWWAGDSVETSAPPTVRLWSSLSPEAKEELTVQGYALFPEVLNKSSSKKYNRYSLWMVTQKGVVNTNIRDSFSAGGKVTMRTSKGIDVRMPAAFGRIRKYHELIQEMIETTEADILEEYWETDIEENRIRQWCQLVAQAASTDPDLGYGIAWDILSGIFPKADSDVKKHTTTYTTYTVPNMPTAKVAEKQAPYLSNVGQQKANALARTKTEEKVNISIEIGDSVLHATYGRGIAVGFKNGTIIVDFESKKGVQFKYPDAFKPNGFLKKV